MFYSQFILAKKGPLGTIWIAAHLERKLRKNQVADTDIAVSVDSILFPDAPIALRLSSHLLLGVVRIYSRKVNYLFDDCSEALLKIKQAFRSAAVDLPPEESTAPYHSITLPETFDLDDFELPDSDIFHGNYVDHHVSSREQITLQDTMEGVIYSTSQFGLDERFGDGDTSGLDLDEELFLDKVSNVEQAGVMSNSDVGLESSVQQLIPLKQDENHEMVIVNSESVAVTDHVNQHEVRDGDNSLIDDAQAPRTPGLMEESNLPNVQETSVYDDHLESESHNQGNKHVVDSPLPNDMNNPEPVPHMPTGNNGYRSDDPQSSQIKPQEQLLVTSMTFTEISKDNSYPASLPPSSSLPFQVGTVSPVPEFSTFDKINEDVVKTNVDISSLTSAQKVPGGESENNQELPTFQVSTDVEIPGDDRPDHGKLDFSINQESLGHGNVDSAHYNHEKLENQVENMDFIHNNRETLETQIYQKSVDDENMNSIHNHHEKMETRVNQQLINNGAMDSIHNNHEKLEIRGFQQSIDLENINLIHDNQEKVEAQANKQSIDRENLENCSYQQSKDHENMNSIQDNPRILETGVYQQSVPHESIDATHYNHVLRPCTTRLNQPDAFIRENSAGPNIISQVDGLCLNETLGTREASYDFGASTAVQGEGIQATRGWQQGFDQNYMPGPFPFQDEQGKSIGASKDQVENAPGYRLENLNSSTGPEVTVPEKLVISQQELAEKLSAPEKFFTPQGHANVPEKLFAPQGHSNVPDKTFGPQGHADVLEKFFAPQGHVNVPEKRPVPEKLFAPNVPEKTFGPQGHANVLEKFFAPQGHVNIPEKSSIPEKLFVPQGHSNVPEKLLFAPQGHVNVPEKFSAPEKFFAPPGHASVPEKSPVTDNLYVPQGHSNVPEKFLSGPQGQENVPGKFSALEKFFAPQGHSNIPEKNFGSQGHANVPEKFFAPHGHVNVPEKSPVPEKLFAPQGHSNSLQKSFFGPQGHANIPEKFSAPEKFFAPQEHMNAPEKFFAPQGHVNVHEKSPVPEKLFAPQGHSNVPEKSFFGTQGQANVPEKPLFAPQGHPNVPEKFFTPQGHANVPEKLMFAPQVITNVPNNFIMDFTPKRGAVLNEGYRGSSQNISGKKRMFTENAPTVESLNSFQSFAVPTKGTVNSITSDNDLLSSILVGKGSPALNVKPTPPVMKSMKRPRPTPRTIPSKRKVLVDDSMVLHGDTIRQQLTSTEEIRRLRKKAPCTRPDFLMIQNEFNEDEMFNESVLSGVSKELASLHNRTYDLRGTKVSQSNLTGASNEAATQPKSISQNIQSEISTVSPKVVSVDTTMDSELLFQHDLSETRVSWNDTSVATPVNPTLMTQNNPSETRMSQNDVSFDTSVNPKLMTQNYPSKNRMSPSDFSFETPVDPKLMSRNDLSETSMSRYDAFHEVGTHPPVVSHNNLSETRTPQNDPSFDNSKDLNLISQNDSSEARGPQHDNSSEIEVDPKLYSRKDENIVSLKDASDVDKFISPNFTKENVVYGIQIENLNNAVAVPNNSSQNELFQGEISNNISDSDPIISATLGVESSYPTKPVYYIKPSEAEAVSLQINEPDVVLDASFGVESSYPTDPVSNTKPIETDYVSPQISEPVVVPDATIGVESSYPTDPVSNIKPGEAEVVSLRVSEANVVPDATFGRLNEPNVVLDASFGRINEPNVVLDATFGRINEPNVVLDATFGRINEPNVVLDATFGRINEPNVVPDATFGRINEPNVVLDATFGRINEPNVAPDATYGRINEPDVVPDATIGVESSYSTDTVSYTKPVEAEAVSLQINESDVVLDPNNTNETEENRNGEKEIPTIETEVLEKDELLENVVTVDQIMGDIGENEQGGLVNVDAIFDAIEEDNAKNETVSYGTSGAEDSSFKAAHVKFDLGIPSLDDGENQGQQEISPLGMMAPETDAVVLNANDSKVPPIGHDTGFLNADDNDDEEADDDNVPGADFLENSGWSSRTRAVANYLQTLFDKEPDRRKKVVPINDLLAGKTRKEASRMFFETLVLKTKDYIHVEQEAPFDNINLLPRVKLMKSTF